MLHVHSIGMMQYSLVFCLQLTAQRTSRLSGFDDEVSSTSEPQRKVTCVITGDGTSSPMRLDSEHVRVSHLRPHSPIVSTSCPQDKSTRHMRVIVGEGTSSPIKLDSHIRSPLLSPTKSHHPSSSSLHNKKRPFSTGMSDDLRLQNRQVEMTDVHTSPMKVGAHDSLSSGAKPEKNLTLSSHASAFSPVKDSAASAHKPSQTQCSSIFARRPNLMSRTSAGLSQFSLQHLDGPGCKQFALDHLQHSILLESCVHFPVDQYCSDSFDTTNNEISTHIHQH